VGGASYHLYPVLVPRALVISLAKAFGCGGGRGCGAPILISAKSISDTISDMVGQWRERGAGEGRAAQRTDDAGKRAAVGALRRKLVCRAGDSCVDHTLR
jgi:predicted secreted protein